MEVADDKDDTSLRVKTVRNQEYMENEPRG
jgi:hypothetical protein